MKSGNSGEEELQGFERSGEAARCGKRSERETTNSKHNEMHANVGPRTNTNPGKKDTNARKSDTTTPSSV